MPDTFGLPEKKIITKLSQISDEVLGELSLYLAQIGTKVPIGQVPGVIPWQSFTPTWTCSTTPPSLGNGTLIGRWTQISNTVIGHIRLVGGSTTSYGAGKFRFTLPVSTYSSMWGGIGIADAVDASSGNSYTGETNLVDGTTFEVWTNASPIGVWQQNAASPPATPFIWATGDELRAKFLFEAKQLQG